MELGHLIQLLKVVNTNTVADTDEPFSVSLSENQMTWTREEGGQTIEVLLVRADELPSTLGDRSMGLWQLESAEGDGPFFAESFVPGENLFIRWDGKFELGTAQGKIYGVHNAHAHKPELEFIPYGEMERSFWRAEATHDSLVLTLLNSESTIRREFKRIDRFPED